MATATKAENGKISADTVAEAAEQATHDVKAFTDLYFDAANKAMEEAKAVASSQQKVWQDSFELWKSANQTYFDFIFGAAQQSSEQFLTFFERWEGLTESNLKKAQELLVTEQTAAFETAEALQAQAKASSERYSKLFS